MINYHRVLETDQYWGDVNYLGVVEAQGSILRSSSMWMVSESAFFTIEVTQCSICNSCDVSLSMVERCKYLKLVVMRICKHNITLWFPTKSPFWQVCYFWRLVNPQMITQVQNKILQQLKILLDMLCIIMMMTKVKTTHQLNFVKRRSSCWPFYTTGDVSLFWSFFYWSDVWLTFS